jgi:hypothetical protein
MADEDPTTQELRLDQLEREREERRSAGRALAPEEAEQHSRRADKAGYLREKLEERARAEGRLGRDGGGR